MFKFLDKTFCKDKLKFNNRVLIWNLYKFLFCFFKKEVSSRFFYQIKKKMDPLTTFWNFCPQNILFSEITKK